METPTLSPPPPPRSSLSTALAAVGLVAVIVVAAAVFIHQYRKDKVEYGTDAPGPTGSVMPAGTKFVESGPCDLTTLTEDDGIIERAGHGTSVVICASVPPGEECHAAALVALREYAERYPDLVSLTVCQIHTKGATVVTGSGCAGYSVNGRRSFAYKLPDGAERRAVFFQTGANGTWTVDDLRAAVEDAMARARTETGA
jgi:hypothetical protein